MFHISRLLVFAYLAALALPAQALLDEAEIDRLEDLRYQAMIDQDYDTLDRIIDDSWVYNQANGKVVPKAQYLANLKTGAVRIYRAQRYDVTTTFYGDTAVVMGKTDVELARNGKDETIRLIYLNVWLKGYNGWKLVARQSTYFTP
jgi:hypothetical protein